MKRTLLILLLIIINRVNISGELFAQDAEPITIGV